jgi:hypothetical protein
MEIRSEENQDIEIKVEKKSTEENQEIDIKVEKKKVPCPVFFPIIQEELLEEPPMR